MFTVLGGKIWLEEGPVNYRPSEDSLWLAGLLPDDIPAECMICDAGCGSGAVGLSYLAKRNKKASLYGFDSNPQMITAAKKSAEANKSKAHFEVGDISAPPFGEEEFALVFANPPFYRPTREMVSELSALAEVKFSPTPLEDWLESMIKLAANGSYIGLIAHKKDQASLMNEGSQQGAGCVKAYSLQSAPGKGAKRTVLIFKKGAEAQKVVEETIRTYDPETRDLFLT